MDTAILHLFRNFKAAEAVAMAKKLAAIYEQDTEIYKRMSLKRTYFDAFQMAIASKKTVKEAKGFIQKCYIQVDITGPKVGEAKQFKKYIENPSSHPNYGSYFRLEP